MSELPAFIVKYVGEILIHFESYFLKFKNMRTKKRENLIIIKLIFNLNSNIIYIQHISTKKN